MKPAPFRYHAPESVEEAIELLSQYGDEAKLLAGGQSLVPAMNFRLARPAVLLDLNRIPELSYVRRRTHGTAGDPKDGVAAAHVLGEGGLVASEGRGEHGHGDGALLIGAMTRQAAVEHHPDVAACSPLLAAAMPHVAHPQIRNRGTVGGSIAHADPAAELPAVALATGARVKLRNREGERWVASADFFRGLFSTVIGCDDLLVEVEVPRQPAAAGWSFQEVARRHGDYALVGVAATMLVNDDRCTQARIVLFAVDGAPVIAAAAEGCLQAAPVNAARIAQAARVAAHDDIEPIGDIHASAAFRRHLAEVLVRRALTEALGRGHGEPRAGEGVS